jgi:predicted N-acetyltransferase YhbS
VTVLSLVIRPERPEDTPAIARLQARAFGPGRFARTAYRLREGAAERMDLGVTAWVGSFLVGSVRMGPVRTGATRFVMLGPLAVDPSFEGRGIGGTLTRAAIAAARDAGEGLVILVGDAPYYSRFGFSPVPPGRLILPGPVDPARLLWLDLEAGFSERVSGPVEAVRAGTHDSSV